MYYFPGWSTDGHGVQKEAEIVYTDTHTLSSKILGSRRREYAFWTRKILCWLSRYCDRSPNCTFLSRIHWWIDRTVEHTSEFLRIGQCTNYAIWFGVSTRHNELKYTEVFSFYPISYRDDLLVTVGMHILCKNNRFHQHDCIPTSSMGPESVLYKHLP